MGPNLSKDLFFCSSPNSGQKMGPNLSEDLFLIFCFIDLFWGIYLLYLYQIDLSSPNLGGPASIFVPPGKIFL